MARLSSMSGLALAIVTVAVAAPTSRPPGAETLAGELHDDTIELFLEPDLRQGPTRLYLAQKKPLRTHGLPRHDKDDCSSAAWKLPDGVVAVLYEHRGARGRQALMWGHAQCPMLGRWEMNDRASSWRWAYIGGAADASQDVLAARSPRPPGSMSTRALLPTGAMQLYNVHEFNGLSTMVPDITEHAEGRFHPVPLGYRVVAKSLKWDLPPGVIVVFTQRPQGSGGRYAIWGRGEMAATRRWGARDGVASWAWFFIGTPGGDGLAGARP